MFLSNNDTLKYAEIGHRGAIQSPQHALATIINCASCMHSIAASIRRVFKHKYGVYELQVMLHAGTTSATTGQIDRVVCCIAVAKHIHQ